MPRRVEDRVLDSRAAREKLRPRGKPYWRQIEEGWHLGYRRLKGRAGSWSVRRYLGAEQYELEAIGGADDRSDADGHTVLTYWQAVDAIRSRKARHAEAVLGPQGPYTVDDAMADYFKFIEAKRKPVRTAQSHNRVWIKPDLGGIEAGSLTKEQIEDWLNGIANGKARVRTGEGEAQRFKDAVYEDEDEDEEEIARRRQATANRVLGTLKAALNRAWANGKIASDSAWRRVEPFAGVDTARLRYLELSEAARLANACEADFRKLVQGLLCTGARYQQLARATVSDFSPDKGTLRLQSRKGDGRLKSFHAFLNEEGAAFFRAVCAGRTGRSLIFTKLDGTRWRESEQTRPMQEACERAKIDPPIGIHGLRHTWASHAVMNGVPLLVVAQNLGHSDTRMVEKHYGHLAPSYVAEAIRAGSPKFGFKPDSKIAAIR